jgi:hypothetical protein
MSNSVARRRVEPPAVAVTEVRCAERLFGAAGSVVVVVGVTVAAQLGDDRTTDRHRESGAITRPGGLEDLVAALRSAGGRDAVVAADRLEILQDSAKAA